MSRKGVRIREVAAMAVGCVATVAGCQFLVGLHGVELVEPDAGPDAGREAGPDAEPDAAEGGAAPGKLGGSCDSDGGCADQTVCVTRDDICCATLCGLKCEACTKVKTRQANGTCAPILLGEDPDNECADAGGCGMNNQCRCHDGVKDGDETDVDCGGTACPACAWGKKCLHAADCVQPAACVGGTCCNAPCAGSCEFCNSVGHCVQAVGQSDPSCASGLVCGQLGFGCVAKAGAPCSSKDTCLSQMCTAGACAQSPSGGACNTNSDCVSGTCQNYVCM
jgi:hypothetical protein